MSTIGCRALSDQELGQLLGALKTPRDRALLTLLVYTGLRISEALPLQLKHIRAGHLYVAPRSAKGKRARSVLINRALVHALSEYIVAAGLKHADDYLFRAERHPGPISRIAAHQVLSSAAQSLGLSGKVALHSARKTFAARIWTASGKDLLQTQKALGHASPATTAAYLQVDQSVADRLVAGLDFGAQNVST
jgi:integrase/recombinase XerD